MKRLFLYISIFLMWFNTSYAQRISFFDIKIGDKITDHFTYQQIDQYYTQGEPASSGEIVYGKDKIYSYITIGRNDKIFIENFSNAGVQIYYENKTDKIVSIGKVEVSSSLNDCISERNRDALNYKKKNRISSLFNETKDTYEFADGMVDHYITFEGKDRDFSFRCYAYPDGWITKRFQVFLHDFNDYVFKKFSE
jgi:hypothetical protein